MADQPEQDVVIGSNRLWCPETMNGVIGVCADLAVAAGHSHLFAWRLPEGDLVATWPRHQALFATDAMERVGDEVRFEAGGRRLVVGLHTGELRDEGPGRPWSGKYPHYGPIRGGRWTLEGDLGKSRLTVRDAAGRPLFPEEPPCTSSEIAVAAGVVVAGAPGGAGTWDLETGRRFGLLEGLRSQLRAFGDVVAASMHDGVARWDPRTGLVLAKCALPGLVECGSFDGAGRRFVATLYRLPGGLCLEEVPNVWLADLDDGRVDVLELPEEVTRTVAMAPDGARIAVCDEAGLRVHAIAPGWPVLEQHEGGRSVGMWFGSDGRVLAADEDRVWFVGAGPLVPFPGRVHRWLADGLLVTDGPHVRIVDPDTAQVRAAWTFPASVEGVSLDGNHLAVSTTDGCLRIRRIG